jgi:arylsulfatase A-like enzyme
VEKQKELIHGYYAAMSYTDAQILKLLEELDRLGIRQNTIVVIWGDHGWHLGDHGLWNKHTNFEQAAHTLLIMSVPGSKPGIRPQTLCEFTDIYPTLCDLTGLPIPDYLDGISLSPAIKDPGANLRPYAFSQYPRGNEIMGYSIRTSRFRYTEWLKGGFRTNDEYNPNLVIGREMYDYEKDPLETESLVGKPDYRSAQAELEKLFRECMKKENQTCTRYSRIADYHEPVNVSSSAKEGKTPIKYKPKGE